jgi:hypothetical protein
MFIAALCWYVTSTALLNGSGVQAFCNDLPVLSTSAPLITMLPYAHSGVLEAARITRTEIELLWRNVPQNFSVSYDNIDDVPSISYVLVLYILVILYWGLMELCAGCPFTYRHNCTMYDIGQFYWSRLDTAWLPIATVATVSIMFCYWGLTITRTCIMANVTNTLIEVIIGFYCALNSGII